MQQEVSSHQRSEAPSPALHRSHYCLNHPLSLERLSFMKPVPGLVGRLGTAAEEYVFFVTCATEVPACFSSWSTHDSTESSFNALSSKSPWYCCRCCVYIGACHNAVKHLVSSLSIPSAGVDPQGQLGIRKNFFRSFLSMCRLLHIDTAL